MIIAILIIAFILFAGSVLDLIKNNNSDLLLTTSLVVLLAWQVNSVFGITMCVFGSILVIIGIVKAAKGQLK